MIDELDRLIADLEAKRQQLLDGLEHLQTARMLLDPSVRVVTAEIDVSTVVAHVPVSAAVLPEQHVCPHCDQVCASANGLGVHVARSHGAGADIVAHRRAKDAERKRKEREAKVAAKGGTVLSCPQCGRSIANKAGLSMHLKKCTPLDPKVALATPPPKIGDTRPAPAPLTSVPSLPADDDDLDRVYRCGDCNEEYPTLVMIAAHTDVEHRRRLTTLERFLVRPKAAS